VLLASLVVFAGALVEAVRWYGFDTSLILAGDSVPLRAVGENIRNFTWGLILHPFWWPPFGLIGAIAGPSLRRPPRRARGPRDPVPRLDGHLTAH
jgi:hypothetical protein